MNGPDPTNYYTIHACHLPVSCRMLQMIGPAAAVRYAADATRTNLLNHGQPGPLRIRRGEREIVFYREVRSL